jgi:hypothetical protein
MAAALVSRALRRLSCGGRLVSAPVDPDGTGQFTAFGDESRVRRAAGVVIEEDRVGRDG